MMKLKTLSRDSLQSKANSCPGLMFLIVSAQWSGNSYMLNLTLINFSEAFPKPVTVYKVDYDHCKKR